MDVGGWLRRIGLEQYEAAFRENKIDDTVLPSLTAEDLKDLGVRFVGDRRKLLDAIAALRAEASAPTPLSGALLETDNAAKDTAERRQVTVMFSDLVGSTFLSAQMDPEDLREIISAYQTCVANTVRRFGGFVAHGRRHPCLFWIPTGARGRRRANCLRSIGSDCRSGLTQIVRSTADPRWHRHGAGGCWRSHRIGRGAGTRHRWGNTQCCRPPAGCGRAERGGHCREHANAFGDLFELKDLGPQELKGIPGSINAWAALRSSVVEGRFEALHTGSLTELVGRQEELELLLRRWSRARTGEGQVVLLTGEAGIGKSRLTAAFLESLANEPHTRLRYFCSPQHTESALYPIIGQMERAAGLTHDEKLHGRLDKLDAVLAQTSTSIQDAALFAEMLSLPNDGRYPTLELTPQQRREKTLEALVSQLVALTRQNPVLMIFEDAHWTDPTSLEVLGRVVEGIASLPVLLIVTFRPEFEPPWIGQPHVTALTINRLTQRDAAAIIDHVVGNKLLPLSIRQEVVERTDGVPLFVEEMTKAVLEAESAGAVQRMVAAVPSPALMVPASLHASLMARLDRIGPAKEIAAIGAAIGREFSHAVLAAVTGKPEPELGSAIGRLIQAGLLFRRGMPPHATYLFKHALVQDAAYGTLLREARRALHARIAEALESQFVEIEKSQAEILAHHCTEAGLIEKAAGLWGLAGQQSLTRSALVEAAAQLTRALDQIVTLPGTEALRRQQIQFQVALANAFMHTKGYAAPETKAAFDQARSLIERTEALGEPPEDPLLLFSVLYGFWVANYVTFNGDAARHLAAQFLALAEKQRVTVPLMIGHRLMGCSLLLTGELAEGRAHLDHAIALYDPAEHRPLATRFGLDVRVITLSYQSWALWLLGYPEAALKKSDDALKNAREMGQAATLMLALYFAAMPYTLCGNHAAAAAHAQELVALAEEKGSSFWKTNGIEMQGGALALTGKAQDAVQPIISGITAGRSTGTTVFMPWYLSCLARAYAKLGQYDDAWCCIGEAMTAVETTKEKWCEVEIYRTRGEITLMSPEPDVAKAEAYFERALAIARAQQAKSWELRAAISMARLWRDQGKRDEARELLAPVYGWFTEGFDTLDLKQAKALLDELA